MFGFGSSGKQKDRRAKRHPPRGGIRCPLGKVVDFSASGLQVRLAGKPTLAVGDATRFDLTTVAGREPVQARVCWLKRAGLRGGHLAGLKFMAVPADQAQRLDQLARYGFLPEGGPEAGAEVGRTDPDAPRPDPSAGSQAGTAAPDPATTAGASSSRQTAPAVPAADTVTDPLMAPFLEVLGLAPGASRQAIRSAYRKEVRHCHPDVAQGDEAMQRFLALQKAYDVLTGRSMLTMDEALQASGIRPAEQGGEPPAEAA